MRAKTPPYSLQRSKEIVRVFAFFRLLIINDTASCAPMFCGVYTFILLYVIIDHTKEAKDHEALGNQWKS